MKILCKIFKHKWEPVARQEGYRTMLEADYTCKRCKWKKMKKQYIGTVLTVIYDDEWQKVKEWIQENW